MTMTVYLQYVPVSGFIFACYFTYALLITIIRIKAEFSNCCLLILWCMYELVNHKNKSGILKLLPSDSLVHVRVGKISFIGAWKITYTVAPT